MDESSSMGQWLLFGVDKLQGTAYNKKEETVWPSGFAVIKNNNSDTQATGIRPGWRQTGGNQMKKKIIAISREFGSGGRSIGKMVAQRLGFRFFDKELVKEVAARTGISEAVVEEQGEYTGTRNWLSYLMSFSGGPKVRNGMRLNDFVWVMQSKIIRDLAEQEPCVIVGRGADFILRDRKDCLRVLIHASLEFREERVVRQYGEREVSAEERILDKDRRRRLFYKKYTGRDWGMAENYHITLDSGELGLETCAGIIAGLAEG